MASILTVLNCVQCVVTFFFFKLFSFVHGNMCVDKFIMLLTQAANFDICHADMPLTDYTNHLLTVLHSVITLLTRRIIKQKAMLGPPSLAF